MNHIPIIEMPKIPAELFARFLDFFNPDENNICIQLDKIYVITTPTDQIVAIFDMRENDDADCLISYCEAWLREDTKKKMPPTIAEITHRSTTDEPTLTERILGGKTQ